MITRVVPFSCYKNRVGRWALTLNSDITLKHDDGLYYSTDYLIVHMEQFLRYYKKALMK